jgi:hypothetical protein
MIKVIEKSRISTELEWQTDTFECETITDWVKKFNFPFYNQTDEEWAKATKECEIEQMALPENERRYMIIEPKNWYEMFKSENNIS